MIDLHLHMDGSLTPELVGELAAERSIRLARAGGPHPGAVPPGAGFLPFAE